MSAMQVTDTRSAAAYMANRTRRINAAAEQLRALPQFTSADKSRVRSEAITFLAQFGGPCGDLHGPSGQSALESVKAGMEVISCENLSFLSSRVDLPRSDVAFALRKMAQEGGYRLHIGDFIDIVPQLRVAFFDACGPLAVDTPSERSVLAMVEHRLAAFAVTVMLSRVEGVKEKGSKALSDRYYIALAKAVLGEDAPGYRIVKVLRYRGEQNVPFAVFLLQRMVCVASGCLDIQDVNNRCRSHHNERMRGYARARREKLRGHYRAYRDAHLQEVRAVEEAGYADELARRKEAMRDKGRSVRKSWYQKHVERLAYRHMAEVAS